MVQALFYPWIDIQDEAWLKTSLLYWDSIRTIVPESIDASYSTETGRNLYFPNARSNTFAFRRKALA